MFRRRITVLIALVVVFGGVLAMAASLGGLTPATLGADDALVSSCDTDGVGTTYASSWDATDARYETTSVTVTGVSDVCDGKTMKVTLTDAGDASLGEGTLVIPTSVATSHAVGISPGVSTAAFTGIHVTIGS